MSRDELNDLFGRVLKAAFVVHTALGPGLLESSYEACLCEELEQAGIGYQRQLAMPLMYRGKTLAEVAYRLDLLIHGQLIVEIKAVDVLASVHHAQLLSYLRLSGRRLGLLINFDVVHLRDGIHRKVNGP